MTKLWGGRFQKETDRLVEDFHSSISFDRRLYKYDILGSIAHARMLGRAGIIEQDQAGEIVRGLEEVLADIEAGRVEFSVGAEDIHMNIEQLLTAKIGEAGKKLHTARSRNDQVALDIRMYIKAEMDLIGGMLRELQSSLLDLAERHIDTFMRRLRCKNACMSRRRLSTGFALSSRNCSGRRLPTGHALSSPP
jgi:argininosuccinate lyase